MGFGNLGTGELANLGTWELENFEATQDRLGRLGANKKSPDDKTILITGAQEYLFIVNRGRKSLLILNGIALGDSR